MTPVWAIARQTFREGVRMRIVLVFIVVMAVVILRLPFAMKGDETLAGRLQSFLDYSLGALSLFASLATVFFSCATLAGEIRNNQIHMVVSKPVSRLQILAGKWLGVNLLNLLLVVLCGLVIYGFARHIRNSQAQFARDRVKVDNVVWTARVSVKPARPDFDADIKEYVAAREKEGAFDPNTPEGKRAARVTAEQRAKEMFGRWLKVETGTGNLYKFENIPTPDEKSVFQVRFKARTTPLPKDDLVDIYWMFVDPDTNENLMPAPHYTNGRVGDMHEFLVQGAGVVKNGNAALLVMNPGDDSGQPVDVFFEGVDSLQLLYTVGGFDGNYFKNLLMILSRLAFLSAVGLMFGVFVSFPVAALCTFTVWLIGLGHDWWMESIGANMEVYDVAVDPYGKLGPLLRTIMVPILKVGFPNFMQLDGTARLIAGEAITTDLLGFALLHTIVFGGILLLLLGWLIFKNREIAEVTV